MNRILVGYDPEGEDRGPVAFGALVARRTRAPLVIVAVHPASSPFTVLAHDVVGEAQHEETGRRLGRLVDELAAAELRVEAVPRPGSSPAHELHDASQEFHAGLVVIGSSERGAVRRLASSPTADRLLHGSPCSVAVVPRSWEPGGGLATVGAAFEDTPEARDALIGAAAIARRFDARLRVLGVVESEDEAAAVRASAERALVEADQFPADGTLEFDIQTGDPGDVLVDASADVELLLAGSRGYGPKRAVLAGGVSRRLAAEALCPVIVLPRGMRAGLDSLVSDRSAAPA